MSMFDYDAWPVTLLPVLAGTAASRGAYAIRDFLSRNGYPFEWVDAAQSPQQDSLDRWSRAHRHELAALEETWAAHTAGDTLLHTDVRADNLLLTPDGVVVVDWPYACRGAAFVEPVLFAPSVTIQGGPEPADVLALSSTGRTADQEDLAATICGLAGYLTYWSLQPAPAGLPTLRAFQAAQGRVARRRLRMLA